MNRGKQNALFRIWEGSDEIRKRGNRGAKVNPNTFRHNAPEFPLIWNKGEIVAEISKGVRFIRPEDKEELVQTSLQVVMRVRRNILYLCERNNITTYEFIRILNEYGIKIKRAALYSNQTLKTNRHYSMLFINTIASIFRVPVAVLVGIDLRDNFTIEE